MQRGLPADNTTVAAQAGLNKTISSLESYCYSGLIEKMMKVFGAPAVWVSSTDEVQAVKKSLSAADGSAVSYPFLILRRTAIQKATDRGSNVAHHAFGARVSVNLESNTAYIASLVPVNVTVAVKLYTNSDKSIDHFANSWFMASSAGHISFDVAYGETDVSISFALSESLSLPTREGDPGSIQELILETELTCFMYLSDPVLRQAKLASKLDVDMFEVSEVDLKNSGLGLTDKIISTSLWTTS